jgi:hypothetical protein
LFYDGVHKRSAAYVGELPTAKVYNDFMKKM